MCEEETEPLDLTSRGVLELGNGSPHLRATREVAAARGLPLGAWLAASRHGGSGPARASSEAPARGARRSAPAGAGADAPPDTGGALRRGPRLRPPALAAPPVGPRSFF